MALRRTDGGVEGVLRVGPLLGAARAAVLRLQDERRLRLEAAVLAADA